MTDGLKTRRAAGATVDREVRQRGNIAPRDVAIRLGSSMLGEQLYLSNAH